MRVRMDFGSTNKIVAWCLTRRDWKVLPDNGCKPPSTITNMSVNCFLKTEWKLHN